MQLKRQSKHKVLPQAVPIRFFLEPIIKVLTKKTCHDLILTRLFHLGLNLININD